jgi:hypothetical protein
MLVVFTCVTCNCSILTHLETLKHEAAEVAKKVEETDVVMAEVETTSQQYVPLAQSCSSIYFTLEALQQVQHTGIQIKRSSFEICLAPTQLY